MCNIQDVDFFIVRYNYFCTDIINGGVQRLDLLRGVLIFVFTTGVDR